MGGGLTWQSKIYSTSFDSYGLRDYATQKSYTVVNLMARYSFSENMSVSANMNNVFDKNYREGGNLSLHGSGAPRNLYVTLKYQF